MTNLEKVQRIENFIWNRIPCNVNNDGDRFKMCIALEGRRGV